MWGSAAEGIKNLVHILTLPDPAFGDRPSCRETAALALVALFNVNKISQVCRGPIARILFISLPLRYT